MNSMKTKKRSHVFYIPAGSLLPSIAERLGVFVVHQFQFDAINVDPIHPSRVRTRDEPRMRTLLACGLALVLVSHARGGSIQGEKAMQQAVIRLEVLTKQASVAPLPHVRRYTLRQ